MKVTNNIDNINFGASPCKKTHIKIFDEKLQKFVKCPVTLIKLDAKNELDRYAVHFAEQTWKEAKYIKKIATASHFMSFNEIDIFALTTQKKNFDELIFNKIIGFAEMRPDETKKRAFLNRLQIRPDVINVNQSAKKTHKHVGKAFLNSLKKVYKKITLDSEDSPNIIKFYKNNGFIENYLQRGRFQWNSNPIANWKLKIRNYMAKHFLIL